MSGDRSFRSRVEVWLYRRLRPLVIERQERRSLQIESPALLPEPTRRPGGLARWRKLAAGAVLVAAATGGTVIGYWWGHEPAERASPDPAVHAPKVVPGPPPEDAPQPAPNRDAPEADVPVPPSPPQPAPNQDAPASKSERQRPDQN